MNSHLAPPRTCTRSRVLLVEDDAGLAAMLTKLMSRAGHEVEVATDGLRGLHLGLTGRFDLLIVDRGLPALEGTELIRTLRQRGVSVPALLLTARATVEDRIEGLDAGAEDYLIKPFDANELLARLRALGRRHREAAQTLPLGPRTLMVGERRVVGADTQDVALSPRESALLELLARYPEQVFSREDLLSMVFGDADTSGVVDTYVHYVRRKLGREVVRTVRGRGYRLGVS